ncbi:MAG: choice-of-anchor A family protein [Methylococcales bacterium]|nr:choice-of-anchor A family protein [Methylococcales bacterium]
MLLLISAMQTAHADFVEAVSLLDKYNLITTGNVTSYSEVDGNALIGGNLTGGNYHIHNTSTAAPALTVGGNVGGNVNVNGPGLDVGGSIQGNVNMNGGGNAYAGSVSGGATLQNNANGNGSSYVVGNIAGAVNTNGGGTYYGGALTGTANGAIHTDVTMTFNPQSVAEAAANTLSGFSDALSGQTVNSTYSVTGNTATFNAESSGLSVFTITDANSFFSQVSQIQFNLQNGAQEILINVINSSANSTLNIDANFLGSAATALGANLLWNFENADNISIGSQFGGTVLALAANVSTSQNIEGTLVAASLTQGGEIHSQPLSAGYANLVTTLASSSTTSASGAAIPEPGMLALIALGWLAMGLGLRHARRS